MHTANTLAYFKKSFVSKKYITLNFKEKMYFSMNFAKENNFLHFWILQHVCKIQRVLANIPKILKKFKIQRVFFLLIRIIYCWYLDK